MKSLSVPTAYLLISHGSRDVRPAKAMNMLRNMVSERLSQRCRLERGLQGPVHVREEGGADDRSLPHRDRHRDVDSRRYAERQRLGLSYAKAPCVSQENSAQGDASISLVSQEIASGALTAKARSRAGEAGQVDDDNIFVETACLELSDYPLHHQIYQFGRRLAERGVDELKLVPIFLMAGMHVMSDIPSEVAIAQSLLGDALKLTICTHLGSHPKMPAILRKRLTSVTTPGSLLVAHGSRRPKGNQSIQSLAQQLGTPVAYWSISPDIETQAIALMQQGCQGITILPYFLFAGGITDAIAHRTEELAERFPRVTFRLLPTLGATEEIADLIIDLF